MAEIEKYFKVLVESGASDLHMCSKCAPYLRINGDMQPIDGHTPLEQDHILKMLKEIIPAHNLEQFESLRDTDFAYEVADLARFRVNAFIDQKGPGMVFRIIPSKIASFEELGVPHAAMQLCNLSKGLVVVTGPTGSGKSTTLASMVDYVNAMRKEHIITIEDPIEFVHNNKQCLVNQREIQNHTMSFKNALRAALREDPDIVLVGEMRDLETIEIALETAETGHLVFGTLHTMTAASTVERIIEQFPGGKQNQIRQMLSNSLKGVIAQALLKKRDGNGRMAVMELLIVTSAISNLIREGKTYQIPSAMQTGGRHGMILLNDALMNAVRARKVTAEEAYLKSVDKIDFENKLGQEGIRVSFSREELPSTAQPLPTQKAPGQKVNIAIKKSSGFKAPQAKTPVPATDDFKSFRERMFQKRR